MGAPRQELWIQKNLAQTGAIVGIGVGGLFDFYSGRIPRAPIWLREIGGEWIYRLMQEPSRMWKRYLIGNVTFLMRIFLERSTSKSDKRNQK
jgi:exopolysaccharide biosynthesis WecB/TagA/CpsF family protein